MVGLKAQIHAVIFTQSVLPGMCSPELRSFHVQKSAVHFSAVSRARIQISGLFWGRLPFHVVATCVAGQARLAISTQILTEYERVSKGRDRVGVRCTCWFAGPLPSAAGKVPLRLTRSWRER